MLAIPTGASIVVCNLIAFIIATIAARVLKR